MKSFNKLPKIVIKFYIFAKVSITYLLVLLFIATLLKCNQNHDAEQTFLYSNDQSISNDYQELESDENNHSFTKVTALIPFIEDGILQNQTCQSCHYAHHLSWPGLTSEVHRDNYYSNPEACKVCHGDDLCTSAPHIDWVSCSSGCHHNGAMAEGHACKPCETCHNGSGGNGCFGSECHGDEGSHATHTSENSKGAHPSA